MKLVGVALWLFTALSVQSQEHRQFPSRIHVSGTISQCGEAVPRSVVKFKGDSTQVVKTNDSGVYEADLNSGMWVLTTPASATDPSDLSSSRPRLIRLTAPGSLILNVYLRPPMICDVAGDGPFVCWGEKSFPLPSSNGVPFKVDLFGLPTGSAVDACSMSGHSKTKHHESATYNLLGLEADKIVYDSGEKTLHATGDVVITDETGKRSVASVVFRLHDGQAEVVSQPR